MEHRLPVDVEGHGRNVQFLIGNHQPATLGHVIASFAIDGDLDIGLFVVTFFGRCCQRQLYRLEDDALGHPLLVGYSLRYQQNFLCHL